MNYFELYPGDYLRDTTRLTLIEHGAYLRLLMAYYAEEQPLPAEEAELYVIVAAVTAADKAAVRKVAARFFPVGEDGLRRNARADSEIEKAQKRIATARANGAKGGRKPRGDGGGAAPAQAPPPNPAGNPPGNPAGTQRDTQRPTHSGEALHTPHAIHHQELSPARASPEPPRATPPTTAAGRACLAMRQAGCVQTNPSHPDLLAALDAGVTPEQLADTVREAIDAGKAKPFTWAIATAHGRLNEARNPSRPTGATAHAAHRPSATDRVAAAIARGREADSQRLDDAIDGQAKRLAG